MGGCNVSVGINLHLRPIRFAFLIRLDDQKHVLEALCIRKCQGDG